MHADSATDVRDDEAGRADIVIGILSQATPSPVALDASLREQGLTSFHAVLVAAALEEHGCDELDYAELLAATPRQLAELIPAA